MQSMIPEQRKSLFRPLVISYVIVSILLLIFDYMQHGSITDASLALLGFLIIGLIAILLSKWKVKNKAIQEGLFLFLAIMLVFLLVVAYLILQL